MDAQLLATRGWHVALKWRVSVGVSVDELVSFLRRKARQCGLRLVQVPAASTRASNGRAIGGPFSPPFVVPCAPPLVALALRALCAAGGGFDFALEREGAGGRCAPGTRYVQRAGVALVEVTEAGFVWVSNTLHALSVDEAGKVRSSLELLADFRARVALEHQRSLAQESRRENADAGSVTVA
ncbi:hypothetical protein T492DRAFT_1059579 [Pavlovales sp. CCMP2436]|nr:hypothetical protein T492DRAFT_1059579 [Pavlovales sp. CCMP2436]